MRRLGSQAIFQASAYADLVDLLRQQQGLAGSSAGAQLLRSLIKLFDFIGAFSVEQRGKVGDPFQPEPGARCAMNAKICEQLVRRERGKRDSGVHLHGLRGW